LATRPPHCPFQDTTRPWPVPYFLFPISHVIPTTFSPYISYPVLLTMSTLCPYVWWPTRRTPGGPYKGCFL
jgi:hypothetical protein